MGRNQKYFWHGLAVKTDFGVVYQPENTEKPLYWYNYECNWDTVNNKPIRAEKKVAMIPAIKVTTEDGYTFFIANHFGIGAHKLKHGGWPNYRHFSLSSDAKFEGVEELGSLRIMYSIREFDEDGFSEYEAGRKKWQKKTYPEEYDKLKKLKNSFKNMRK